jgi:WD40 repeat protein
MKRIYVVDGGDDRIVRAWDVATGRVTATHQEHDGFAGLALTSDGKSLLAPQTRRVVVLDAKNLHVRGKLEAPAQILKLEMIEASPESNLVVAATPSGLIVWRLADGAIVATVDLASKVESPSALAFSPDGKMLWMGTSIGDVLAFHVVQ